ncbi:MAG TPA: hypothetical protein VIM12_03585 [Noviherbaspirillum sp.]|jgi:hypothetical protein|uniref:hypothetical protein n=1 Tax=Noviherbaspirillum sp. TaxID=1926288 RepID=UPI002F925205
MRKTLLLTILAATASAFTAAAPARAEDCAEFQELRAQRDEALRKKDAGQYCKALSGLMKLHPEAQPSEAKLKCEAGNMPVKSWNATRPQVISMMKETYTQQCR